MKTPRYPNHIVNNPKIVWHDDNLITEGESTTCGDIQYLPVMTTNTVIFCCRSLCHASQAFGKDWMVNHPVMTVTFCNPHQCIPESSASFPSPQAQSRNPTLIPNSECPFLITLNHSRPDWAQPNRLYLSLVSSSSLSLAFSHTLPLPLSRSLRLTLLVLRLRQPYTT